MVKLPNLSRQSGVIIEVKEDKYFVQLTRLRPMPKFLFFGRTYGYIQEVRVYTKEELKKDE